MAAGREVPVVGRVSQRRGGPTCSVSRRHDGVAWEDVKRRENLLFYKTTYALT